jgi:ThiF family
MQISKSSLLAHQHSMKRDVQLIFPESLHTRLNDHLFPGDFREHGAVIAAGLAMSSSGPRLLVREVWPASEPHDYREDPRGHMSLQATFIHRCITRCRDQKLIYLAVHNHGGRGQVAFSDVDFASHEKGYRALLDIANGMPVGAVVVADGAMEIDLWNPDLSRSALRDARIHGQRIARLYSNALARCLAEGTNSGVSDIYSRQVLFLGSTGQSLFKRAKVAVIGLGGIGSLVCEYLARLGVGELVLIDPDELEPSNTSRIVGASRSDIGSSHKPATLKVNIAERVARQAQQGIVVECIADDFSRLAVARRVLDCDFIFLAADSMRARLVFNAIVHQYYIPGMQLGSKIQIDKQTGCVISAFSVIRAVRPGEGCLFCNELIDPVKLADEWKSDSDRKLQQYGTESPNPSVITMNAVAASHAVNDFLYAFTGLRQREKTMYRRFNHLDQSVSYEEPRKDDACTEFG